MNRAIDCLRFVAALLVVVGHVRALLLVDYGQGPRGPVAAAFYAVTSLGRQAVYVFFALSGFWVGGWVIRRFRAGDFTWGEHLARRLSRLWTVLIPALVLVTVVDVVGRGAFRDSPFYAGSAAFHGVAPLDGRTHLSIGEFLGNAVFLQGTWVHAYGTDGPLWSLAYEFWYYLLFPVLLVLATARRRRAKTGALVLACLCAVAVGIDGLALFPGWLVGVAAFLAASRIAPTLARVSPRRLGVAQAAAFAIVLCTALASEVAHLPSPVAALATGTATALFLVAAWRSVVGVWLAQPLLRTGSRGAAFSYTLYAVHLPIAILLCAALNRSGERRPFGVVGLGQFFAVTAGCLLAAWAIAAATERHTGLVRNWFVWAIGVLHPSRTHVEAPRAVPEVTQT